MLDPVQLSTTNNPLLLGSTSSHFDHKVPIACRPLIPSVGIFTCRHALGSFDVICSSCGALHWMEERLKNSSRRSPQFGMCCNSGAVSFPSFPDPPETLLSLLQDKSSVDALLC